MIFETPENFNILICPTCKGSGTVQQSNCKTCLGSAVGLSRRGKWFYWSYPLNKFNITLFRAQKVWYKIRQITLYILWINSWIWSVFLFYKNELIFDLLKSPFDFFWLVNNKTRLPIFLFWFGFVFLLFLIFRKIVEKNKLKPVEKFLYNKKNIVIPELVINNWEDIKKIKSNNKINIDQSFNEEALSFLVETYNFVDKNNYRKVTIEHLFYTLLSSNRINHLFIRLGVPVSKLKEVLADFFKDLSLSNFTEKIPTFISDQLWQVIFNSYEEAYLARQRYVSVIELLSSCINFSSILQDLLSQADINKIKLNNVIEWERSKEKLYQQYTKQKIMGSSRSKHGMDKAMTAIATPYLNNFSDDMTRLAQIGAYDFCIARDREIEEIFRTAEGGLLNVILIGPHGVGKKTIIEGLAQKMISEDVPENLKDKRLVRLNISELLSGTNSSGAVQRLIVILNEAAKARNVILFIHNIHELVGVSVGKEGSLSVANTLAEYIRSGNLFLIASSTNSDYAKYISDSPLSNIFSRIEIPEMDENQTIQVIESKVALFEYKHNVFFSYNAIEQSVKLATRFLHETYLPGSALEIASESAIYTKNTKGINSLISIEEVAKVVSDKTGIPVTTVTMDESNKLLKLEQEMYLRVIDQNEAVDLVANALRRARVEIRSKNKPIANFLFLGPTGVGKTELAKTIADIYFGGEEKIIRLDMSEYQNKSSINRLIGLPNEKGTGFLTEAVRKQPFALLLLDEIEKADPDVLHLFLQVMDDGRLTDSVGRLVDFTNLIIIATSNAGTSYVQEKIKQGTSLDVIKEDLLNSQLKSYFRPEFLNRFDGIVLFRSLTFEAIKKIAKLMMQRVIKDLEEKGIQLIVEDEALEYLAEIGYKPEFGARPMRRAIQDKVENKLAELILSGKLNRRDRVVLSGNGDFSVLN